MTTQKPKRDKGIMRAMLAKSHDIDFTKEVFQLSHSQRIGLSDMAKAVGYRKSVSSSLSLGAAFFVYLVRGIDEVTA